MLIRGRAGAFVAVLLGTAVLACSVLVFASAGPRIPDRFAGVPVVVQSPAAASPADPFPPTRPWTSAAATELAGRLAALPGVTAAVPDREFYAQPLRAGKPIKDQTQGYGWASAAFAPYRLTAGRAPAGAREVVADGALGVPVGGVLDVLTATGPATYTVSGLVSAPVLLLSDDAAARLAPGVRAIGLLGDPDPAAVRAAVGAGGTVLAGDDRGALEPRADARTRWIGMQVLTALAALSAFMCVFVVASTSAFAVNQRRRELGLLRAIGATPAQVRRTVYREALTVGALASAAGVLLGAAVSPLLAGVLVDTGFQPPGFGVRPLLWPVAVAFAAGPVVSLLGTWSAARRAARIRPLEALRQAAVEEHPMTRLRWAAGLILAAAGAVAGLITLSADDMEAVGTGAFAGAMALIVAATLLAPAVIPALVRVVLWPASGAIGTLVRGSALTAVRRTASTAAPVLLTVTFTVIITGIAQTSAAAYAARRGDRITAGSVLMPDGTPGLSDAAVAPVRGAGMLPTIVYADTTPLDAIGVDPAAFAEAVPGVSASGVSVSGVADPDAVALTRGTAEQLGWRPGGAAPVVFADGARVVLRVVAVLPDGSIPAGLLLARDLVRHHDPSALTSAVFLPASGAVAPPAPGAVVSASLGARLVTVADYAAQTDAEEDHLVWIFTLLLVAVSAGFGALAVANTLLMATTRRARDLRLLRLAGATRRQVVWTVAIESSLVVVIGTLLGVPLALLALQGPTGGVGGQVGEQVDLLVPWPVIAGVVGVCLVLAVLASAVPARAAASSTRL